jgi:hypothetical protein
MQGGTIFQQSFRAISLVTDKVTDIALQFAPENASPTAVRAAVTGGLILVTLSFVKGVLSFFLTIGTVVFCAFVAVRVFGLDINGESTRKNSSGRRNSSQRKSNKSRRAVADTDIPSLPDAVGGLLTGILGDGSGDDGLLDVWFEGKKKGGKKRR